MSYFFNNYTNMCVKINSLINKKIDKIKKSKRIIYRILQELDHRWISLFKDKVKSRILWCWNCIRLWEIDWKPVLSWYFCNNRFCPYCSISRWIRKGFDLQKRYEILNKTWEYKKYFITLTTTNQDLSLSLQIEKIKESFRKISQNMRNWRLNKTHKWFYNVDWLFYKIEIAKTSDNWNVHIHWVLLSRDSLDLNTIRDYRYDLIWWYEVKMNQIKKDQDILPLSFYINKSDFIKPKRKDDIDDFIEYYNSTYKKRMTWYMWVFRWVR